MNVHRVFARERVKVLFPSAGTKQCPPYWIQYGGHWVHWNYHLCDRVIFFSSLKTDSSIEHVIVMYLVWAVDTGTIERWRINQEYLHEHDSSRMIQFWVQLSNLEYTLNGSLTGLRQVTRACRSKYCLYNKSSSFLEYLGSGSAQTTV